jgi:hypothetical protein
VDSAAPLAQRRLDVLEGWLRIPAGDLAATLSHVSDVIAAATGADKGDAFLYEAARDSLVAVGTSTQPLSALQRQWLRGADLTVASEPGKGARFTLILPLSQGSGAPSAG